jgi:phosphoglycolate phosphatase
MLKRLVLFDIDGTMLWPDGASRAALYVALERVYGTAGAAGSVRFDGRTDRHIVYRLLHDAGLSTDVIGDRFEQLIETMVVDLRRRLAAGEHDIRPCLGAHELVGALAARSDVLLGLLTGNFRPSALIKMQAVDFDLALFRVGAYGDESENRADLPPLAVRRARELTGVHFAGQQVIILGDTVYDVTCGRGIGARSIAVTTGWTAHAELEAAGPDYLFEDLTDTGAVLDAIFAPADDDAS